MANTRISPISLRNSRPQARILRVDAFTVRDGHVVGHDGFIVPNNFSEFYQRFPNYVADWVKRRVRDCASATEAEDWTQELLLHLAVLPSVSMHRRNGKEDVIQTFVPERMHGANEARFRSFINQCLSNKFNTLYVMWRKRPLSNPGNLPLMVDVESGVSDEFCHANSAYLREASRRSVEQDEQRFRLGEFVRLAESSIPGLGRFVEVVGATGSWEETASLLGRKRFERCRRSVRKLAMRMV